MKLKSLGNGKQAPDLRDFRVTSVSGIPQPRIYVGEFRKFQEVTDVLADENLQHYNDPRNSHIQIKMSLIFL